MQAGPATVAELLRDAITRLVDTLALDLRTARIEARVLASCAWRVGPAWLIAHDTDVPSPEQANALAALLARRLAGEPIAYVTGTREFYGRPYAVGPAVLIPRPDTELLVETALEQLPIDAARDVLDLGTGSGCVAITLALARPLARVTAVDRSPGALVLAAENARSLGAQVRFVESDWFAALEGARFDLIVGNPPYVAAGDAHLTRGDLRFEPAGALASGDDGFDDLRRIIDATPAHLRRGGWLWLEHGFEQGPLARALFEAAGFRYVETRKDASRLPRITGGQLSENFTRP